MSMKEKRVTPKRRNNMSNIEKMEKIKKLENALIVAYTYDIEVEIDRLEIALEELRRK